MTIQEKINSVIQEKCLKQSAVGLAAGYDTRKFNDFVKGRRKITTDDVVPICRVLGITPNELFNYPRNPDMTQTTRSPRLNITFRCKNLGQGEARTTTQHYAKGRRRETVHLVLGHYYNKNRMKKGASHAKQKEVHTMESHLCKRVRPVDVYGRRVHDEQHDMGEAGD